MKEKLTVIRRAFSEKREQADDLQIIMAEVMKLPYGQLKRVLTTQILEVLEKYGCGEEN